MKKITVLLAVLMILSTFSLTGAFAASAPKITDINETAWDDIDSLDIRLNDSPVRNVLGMRFSAGSELRIYLTPDMFVDEDGEVFTANLTSSVLRKGKVAVYSKIKQSANLIKEISLEYDNSEKTSYIKIEMVDPMVGSGQRTVSGTISLKVGGKTKAETEIMFEAQMSNSKVEVTEGADYVDVSGGGYYIQPDAFIKNITVDLGNGFSVLTNMHPNKKYYGYIAIDENDLEAANAKIELCYKLSHQNLATGSTAHFNLDTEYYVYDAQGAYLGTTKEALPVVRAFYLSLDKVDELELPAREGSRDGGESTSSGETDAETAVDGENSGEKGEQEAETVEGAAA